MGSQQELLEVKYTGCWVDARGVERSRQRVSERKWMPVYVDMSMPFDERKKVSHALGNTRWLACSGIMA